MANGIDCLLGPRVPDLLLWTIQRLFFSIGPMDDVVPSIDRVVHRLFQILFITLEGLGNLTPRVLDPQERPCDMNATYATQIAEIDEVDHLVSDKQRIGVR